MAHTLLLADDSLTIQRVIELTFADEDVQVVAVSSCDEAIAVLNRTPPDIVLADAGMPRPGGYEIAQYIRDTPELAHIPVVLLTGAFEPVDQSRMAAAGCDGVLAKPFEPQLVIGCVKKLLASPKSRAPSAPKASPPPSLPSTLRTPTAELSRPAKPLSAAQPFDDDLSEYFDRLDQAFANAAAPKAAADASAPPDLEGDWLEVPASTPEAPAADDGWSDLSRPDVPDLRLLSSSPSKDVDSAVQPRAVSSPAPPVPTSRPPDETPSVPESAHPSGIASHVAGTGQQSPALAWPSGTAKPSLPGDLVEQVTRSVLERLSETVVRDTVRDAVRSVAERLVREEIERIKSNIK